MPATTIYDIKLRMLLDDRASGGVNKVDAALRAANKSSGLLAKGLAKGRAGQGINKVGAALKSTSTSSRMATRGINDVDTALKSANNSSGLLSKGLGKLAVIGAGLFGARAAAKSLIGFNADMEQLKLTMSGMINLASDRSWADSIREASALTDRLQQKAKASVGTTKDMVTMASMIAQPILSAGGSMQDLEDIASGAVVAAKALGVESEVAARDIDQAVRGQFRAMDQFTAKLLGSLGFVGEEGRKVFNQMGKEQRKAMLLKAITQPAIANLAAAQEASFAGSFSTFQDNLEMTLGKVGLPLFGRITEELQGWNKWLDANSDTVSQIVDKFSFGMTRAFEVIKDTVSFFVENKDTLLRLAKVWMLVKVGKGMAGFVGGGLVRGGQVSKKLGGGLLSLGMDKAGLGVAKFGSSLFAVGSKIMTRLLPGIGLAAVAFEGLSQWWKESNRDREMERKKRKISKAVSSIVAIKKERRASLITKGRHGRLSKSETDELNVSRQGLEKLGIKTFDAPHLRKDPEPVPAYARTRFDVAQKNLADTDAALLASKKVLLRFIVDEGLIVHRSGRRWEVNTARFQEEVMQAQSRSIGEWRDISTAVFNLEAQLGRSEIDVRKFLGLDVPKTIPSTMPATTTEKPKVNVTINRIEVVSDDPDRFAFGMVSAFRDMAANPSGAVDALRD